MVGSGVVPAIRSPRLERSAPRFGTQGSPAIVVIQLFGSMQQANGPWHRTVSGAVDQVKGWRLTVSTAGQLPEGLGRRVTVAGHEGWWVTEHPASYANGLYWRGDRGNWFAVTGPVTLQKALTIAGSLEPVPPDDPRLQAPKR